jgi:hypothetical protein
MGVERKTLFRCKNNLKGSFDSYDRKGVVIGKV